MTLVVHTDGACRGNPGPSGAGWVFSDKEGRSLGRGNLFLGHRTNNEAEYLAAALGLQAAFDVGARKVCLRADSELMIKQLTGIYRVRNPRILPLYEAVRNILNQFEGYELQHVRREFNQAADAEANRAVDEAPRAP